MSSTQWGVTTDRTDAEPTTIDVLRREVANLTQRLATVEDELAIQRLGAVGEVRPPRP